ncbi:PGC-1 and ERR-induced regulator in muscle protein 1 [Gastrophryne carolinensis]
MDNFEYSIQLSDRDWEEFYSTAEECGLTPVSLATEEELLLSDTEAENATLSSRSSKPRFIRVSLCPHPNDLEPKAPQVAMSASTPIANKWMNPSDDVLSGSEDENEFGSIARFLCQKESFLFKKAKTEHRTDIPDSKPKDYLVTNVVLEHSLDHSSDETLVDFMRNMNLSKKQNLKRDTEHLQDNGADRINPAAMNGSLGRKERHQLSGACDDPLKVGEGLPHPGTGKTDPEMCHLGICTVTNGDQLVSETANSIKTNVICYNPGDPNHNSLHDSVGDDTENCNMQPVTANRNSSAVQQNIPEPTVEILNLSNTQSEILTDRLADSVTVSPQILSSPYYRHPTAEGAAPAHSFVPVTIRESTLSKRSLPARHLASYTNTDLTLPEMYDFFFDDVLESGSVVNEALMAHQKGIVYSPDMYEYFFVDEDNAMATTNTSEDLGAHLDTDSGSLVTSSWPEACEFFFADGPQERGGILFSTPTYRTRSAAGIFQSLVPNRFRGFSEGGGFCGADEMCVPNESPHERSNETSVTTGSLVPHLSSGRSDACLVFLALASWAVKSSDLHSSEGWKTALLANIGALSAISYLRRRRRTRQESLLKPLEET